VQSSHRFILTTVVLTVSFCLTWAGIGPLVHACPQVCCAHPETSTFENVQGIERACHPNVYSRTPEEASCNLSQCCASELPFFTLYGVARVDNPLSTGTICAAVNIAATHTPIRSHINNLRLSNQGLLGPLFLLNATLLC
jgi:hypothetical protein